MTKHLPDNLKKNLACKQVKAKPFIQRNGWAYFIDDKNNFIDPDTWPYTERQSGNEAESIGVFFSFIYLVDPE